RISRHIPGMSGCMTAKSAAASCYFCTWINPSIELSVSRFTAVRAGPTNSDSPISVISARMGDGIARMDGEDDGKKAETESRWGVQGAGRAGSVARRQDVGRGRRAFRGAPAPGDGMEEAAA